MSDLVRPVAGTTVRISTPRCKTNLTMWLPYQRITESSMALMVINIVGNQAIILIMI